MRRVLLLLALALPAAAQTFLIRGATIHPVTKPSISGGMLLIQDGKIAAVGPKAQAPRGAKLIDAAGLHVYPGLIDSATTIGINEVGSVRETQDFSELGDFQPQLRSLITVNPESEHIAVARANGLTSVIVLPQGGMLAGQASLIHLDGWTWEEMSLHPAAAMHLVFPALRTTTGQAPNQRPVPYREAKQQHDRDLQRLNEFFEKSRRYQQARQNPGPDFRTDLQFEAMLPVLEGKLPVMITAAREREIREALDFIATQKIRAILAGIREPGSLLARIRQLRIPVILGKTHFLPLDEDAPYDEQYSLPAKLLGEGIKFAFGTFDSSDARNLPYQAAAAVPFGLPVQEALKAITINAAEIWGVADRIGSIEEGKWADLIITDGDPLETRTQIKQMFIRGRPVNLESKHTRLYEKYMNRP